MKMRIFYNLFALALLAFVFQSRSTGPAALQGIQATGAPANGTCANMGCHTTGAFSPELKLEILDGGNAVTAYIPDKSYTMRVTITPAAGSPNGYGFQALTLDGSDSQAGSWGNVGAGKHVVTIGGRDYVEHNTPNTDSDFFEMEWVAPAAATGDVTVYAAGIAANLNGNAGGDGTAVNTLVLTEDNSSNVTNVLGQYANMKVFPNPVQETLNLEITSRTSGNFTLRFTDISGKVIRSEQLNLHSGLNETSLLVNDLEKGHYILQLSGEAHLTSAAMLKM